jgi:hypothetical protein
VEPVDERARTEAFTRLQELIEIGRRYQAFARQNPSQAAVQIAELNMPGLQEDAWDLLWIPGVLRAKIARISSVVILELCRAPCDPEHDPRLMDVLMPAAIAAACVVAHSYAIAPEIPTGALQGRLDVLASLLHRLTFEQPEELTAITRAHAEALATPLPPIVACLPTRVRDRLIELAHVMAGFANPDRLKVVTVIFTIGAVAAETFESLNLSHGASRPPLPT